MIAPAGSDFDQSDNFYECGLYVGVKVLPPSSVQLRAFMLENGLNSTHRLHMSVVSTRQTANIEPSPQVHTAHFDHYDIFKMRSGVDILVVKLTAPTLVARHHEILRITGCKHDFREFEPHITLSYKWDKLDPDPPPIDFPILIGQEYSYPQDVIWNL